MFGWLKRHYLNLKAPDGASLNWSWQRCRKDFLKNTANICVCCGYEKEIQVHHKKPRHIRPDLAVDQTNLIALCRDCHFHIGHLNNYKTYNSRIGTVSWMVRYNSVLKKNKR